MERLSNVLEIMQLFGKCNRNWTQLSLTVKARDHEKAQREETVFGAMFILAVVQGLSRKVGRDDYKKESEYYFLKII